MPREKNKALRLIVPLVAVAVGIIVISSFIITSQSGSSGSGAASSGQQVEGESQAEQADGGEDASPEASAEGEDPTAPARPEVAAADEDAEQGAQTGAALRPGPEASEPTEVDGAGLPSVRARTFPDAPEPVSIGSLEPESGFELQVDFTNAGAGVESITFTNHARSYKGNESYVLQRRTTAAGYTVSSLAARAVEINDQFVELFSQSAGSRWRSTAPGAFEAVIETDAGDPIARIEKQYSVSQGSFEVRVDQRLVNLTDAPLRVRWFQYGPVDLPQGPIRYGGDKRRIRFAHTLGPERDPSGQFIQTNDFMTRNKALDRITSGGQPVRLWPTEAAVSQSQSLVWTALTNRYFAFAVHPLVDMEAWSQNQQIDKAFRQASEVYAIALGAGSQRTLTLQLNSPVRTVEAGQALDLSLGAYAGPISEKTLRAESIYEALQLDKLIIYNFGGPCAFCTFQPLARLLIRFLSLLHDYLVFDWAIAIMILVVCVRAILHPVTKKSQISIQRFSKQMQALAPKQQKLREKYKDDPKRMQQEMAKLMREEGVSFTGALGCLPMFLQSPIWIALYAMLYFAFELRHEAAFFGFFQTVTGGAWTFLADMSAPDRFIDFGQTLVTIPLLGEISSINILPILLGFVFYVQQKYLSPPPSPTMTEDQIRQQKMIKVMMVVMFPVIIYNAPSGLAIYFITNSALGIAESRYIRAHIDQMDLETKKPTPGEQGKSRKKVQNTAPASPFGAGKNRGREGSPYKRRKKK